MADPTEYINITGLSNEADDIAGLYFAGESVDPSEPTKKIEIENSINKRVNVGLSKISGGKIWPLILSLSLGAQSSSVPAGVSRLAVDTGGDVEVLYLYDYGRGFSSSSHTITNIAKDSFDAYIVTSDGVDYEFVTYDTLKYRESHDARGWGYENNYYLYSLNPIASALGSNWSAIKNPSPKDNTPVIQKLLDDAVRVDARKRPENNVELYGATRTKESTVIRVPKNAGYFSDPLSLNAITKIRLACDDGKAVFVGRKNRMDDDGLTADQDFVLRIGTDGRGAKRVYAPEIENITFTYEGANFLEDDFDSIAHGNWYDGSLHFEKCGGGIWCQEGHYSKLKGCDFTGTRLGLRNFGSWLFTAEDCNFQYNDRHLYSTEDAVTVPATSSVQILQRFVRCSFTHGIVNGPVFFNANSACKFESCDFESNMGSVTKLKNCVNLTFLGCHFEVNGYYKQSDPSQLNWNHSHPSNLFGNSIYVKGNLYDNLDEKYKDTYVVSDSSRRLQFVDGGVWLVGDEFYAEIGGPQDTTFERIYFSGTVKKGSEIISLYGESTFNYGNATLRNCTNLTDGWYLDAFGCAITGNNRPVKPRAFDVNLDNEPKGMRAVTTSLPKDSPGETLIQIEGSISDRDKSQMDCGMIAGGNLIIKKKPGASANPKFETYASIVPPKGGMVTFEDVDFFALEIANPRQSSTDLINYFRPALGVIKFVRCSFGKNPTAGTDAGVTRIYNSGSLVIIYEDCDFDGNKNTNAFQYSGAEIGEVTIRLINSPQKSTELNQRKIALGITGKAVIDAASTGWLNQDTAEFIEVA